MYVYIIPSFAGALEGSRRPYRSLQVLFPPMNLRWRMLSITEQRPIDTPCRNYLLAVAESSPFRDCTIHCRKRDFLVLFAGDNFGQSNFNRGGRKADYSIVSGLVREYTKQPP